MEHSTPQRRRSFKIKTKFGSARQWRSRKNPPCDACRRRKTACIIETSPPCRFCRSKGQVCTSTDIETGRPSRQGPRDTVVESDQDTTDSTVDASYLSIPPLTSPGIESDSFGIPLIAQTTSPSYRSASVAASLTSPGAHLPNSTPRSDNGPVVDTLEDNENRTAHSVGLSGEQDTDLLASFRSFITNERDGVSADVIQAFAGDLEVTAFPIHFNLLTDEFQPADDVAKSRISDAIESMVSPHASTLVRLFFKTRPKFQLHFGAPSTGWAPRFGSTTRMWRALCTLTCILCLRRLNRLFSESSTLQIYGLYRHVYFYCTSVPPITRQSRHHGPGSSLRIPSLARTWPDCIGTARHGTSYREKRNYGESYGGRPT
ncbi:hypothetical protein ASPCAL03177 [Aspergillus calidoustus]|uniref:Zn(2)-C6 fungal-type domain-containing protein n=1 Tax=Aspergillus calidoustus TaxID=454130 RepID=A0A0U5GPQ9_ASPCI|nr:hypothetical protein ASPCAL03177 [Aspergillus calidoustus]